jgi:hypothetical protein
MANKCWSNWHISDHLIGSKSRRNFFVLVFRYTDTRSENSNSPTRLVIGCHETGLDHNYTQISIITDTRSAIGKFRPKYRNFDITDIFRYIPNQVFPLTDWSLEAMKPALTTIIRRLDKLFSKIHKTVKTYQAVEWKAAAGLLNAIYITLWKHPYIVNVPNLKSLIGTCQCLVAGKINI